jgi:hypothetical protein
MSVRASGTPHRRPSGRGDSSSLRSGKPALSLPLAGCRPKQAANRSSSAWHSSCAISHRRGRRHEGRWWSRIGVVRVPANSVRCTYRHRRRDRRFGSFRRFAPVSRTPCTASTATITIGTQRWHRFCDRPCGCHRDPHCDGLLVALAGSTYRGPGSSQVDAIAPARLPVAAWSRRRWRRWRQWRTSRAITRNSDWE